MQALRATDPRRIGPYEVLGRLGAGGMGEVYLAASRSGPRVAVKVVRAEHAEDRTFRARFRHEVRAAQTVGGSGTYTARVVDADTEAERPWMATEFVDGPNLRDAVLDGGPLPGDAVRALAGALGEALAAIHAKGMVHRDLKPSNILLAQDGPRVIDFGIVRALEATSLTRTGTVVGSVGYVSPEQIRNGGEVGPPSDVFSLGAVLAYASAGREPFGEGQDSVVLLRILTRDYDLTGVPDGIRALVEACFAEDPHKRPTPQRVVTAVGHTSSTLRDALRPGWYGNPTAPPSAEPERWLPARDSGERLSGVEYVAPLTTTDTPPPPPAPQPATAEAPALPGPSAPAPAPVPDRHASAAQHPATADTPATPPPAVADAPVTPTAAVADAGPSPARPAPSPGTPSPPQTPEPSPSDAPTPSGRPAPAPASAPERDAPAAPPASGSHPAVPPALAPSGRPAPPPSSAPEPDGPATPPASGSHPAPTPSGRPAPAPASAPEPDGPTTPPASGSHPAAPPALAPSGRPAPTPASAPERDAPAAPPAPPSRQAAPVGPPASAAGGVPGSGAGSVAADTPGPPTAVQPGRRRVLGLLAGGAVTAAAAGTGGWWWLRRSDDKDRDAGHGNADSGGSAAGKPAVLRWQYDVGGLGGLSGPCAAVSPDGTTVYIGGINGTLHAVTAAGAKRWSVRLGDETSTPVATAAGVFCLAWENDRGLRKLHALGPDGTRRWERTLGDNGYDRPLLLDDHLLVALGNTDAGGLRCVAADGSTRWTATTPAGPTDTPLVAGGVVYTGCFGDRLLALDASDGRRLWSVPGGIDVGGPVLVGTTLVADSGGELNRHGFRSRDGRLLWEKEVSSGPLVAGDDALAVAVSGGTFEGVRAADGSTAWTYESPYRDRDPALTVAGGLVYVRAGTELLALGVDGRLHWTVTVGRDAGEDVHAPLVSGRRLYIPSGTGIAAVDVVA
ncbi:protein kinase domain-containing protein [Streptomyces griseosporeus]|uniref:protein kinase domain-containing protein n=1 Tax=Streptomyces griseosporeus TaxID=1910 RepID=UPI0037028AD0